LLLFFFPTVVVCYYCCLCYLWLVKFGSTAMSLACWCLFFFFFASFCR